MEHVIFFQYYRKSVIDDLGICYGFPMFSHRLIRGVRGHTQTKRKKRKVTNKSCKIGK
jgi:hypothetical protein